MTRKKIGETDSGIIVVNPYPVPGADVPGEENQIL